jgi:hypothetical protein
MELDVIDWRLIISETITTMASLDLGIYGYQEQLPAFITELGHYPLSSWLPQSKLVLTMNSNGSRQSSNQIDLSESNPVKTFALNSIISLQNIKQKSVC